MFSLNSQRQRCDPLTYLPPEPFGKHCRLFLSPRRSTEHNELAGLTKYALTNSFPVARAVSAWTMYAATLVRLYSFPLSIEQFAILQMFGQYSSLRYVQRPASTTTYSSLCLFVFEPVPLPVPPLSVLSVSSYAISF